jgi:hypothetical protein
MRNKGSGSSSRGAGPPAHANAAQTSGHSTIRPVRKTQWRGLAIGSIRGIGYFFALVEPWPATATGAGASIVDFSRDRLGALLLRCNDEPG